MSGALQIMSAAASFKCSKLTHNPEQEFVQVEQLLQVI